MKEIKLVKLDIKIKDMFAISKVLYSGNLASGNRVKEFERRVAHFIGNSTDNVIACSSGTAGLFLALKALGIKKGDEVITTPFTFVATTNAILECGATPIYVDVDADYNLNVNLVEKAITKKTKAILTVDLYGYPSNTFELRQICDKHKLFLVDDACQAFGSIYYNKTIGSIERAYAHIIVFSLYATKNLTTGEGGLVVTFDIKLSDKIRQLLNQGQKERYVYNSIGYNFRMTEIQAAIGLTQLDNEWDFKRFVKKSKQRIENSCYYAKKLDAKKYMLPLINVVNKQIFSNLHQYTILTRDREKVIKALQDNKIQFGIYYPKVLYEYEHLKQFKKSCPVAEAMSKYCLSLPIGSHLKKRDILRVIEVLNGVK